MAEGEGIGRARGTDRMLDIMEFLGRHDHAVSAGEIAAALQAPRSSIYTIVDIMVTRGFLHRAPSGSISLGPKIAVLGLAFERGSAILRKARDIARDLSDKTGEIAELNVLDNWKQLVLIAENGPSMNYLRSVEGGRFALPQTASGRFLLEGFDIAEISANIPAADFTNGPGQPQAAQQLIEEGEAAAIRGFVCTRGLIDPNIACIAAPVRNASGKCVAAISLVMTNARFDDMSEPFTSHVVDAAKALSADMGDFTF